MKKALILLLALMLCVSLAAPALAAGPASGKCGDNVTWSLSADGTLTISGTGPMEGYYGFTDAPWKDLREEITSVVIEKGVSTIGNRAFNGCANMTSVAIPDSVTSIGAAAFFNCESLTSAVIPDGVTTLEDSTFYWCNSMTSVTIPDSVTSIGEWSFAYCSSLTSVTIPGGVTSIGEHAFECCTRMTSVTIPDGVTSIEYCTFASCRALTAVTIPVSVTSIGAIAFIDCDSLKDVYYGGSESQWEQIFIEATEYNGENGNISLLDATIHYNSAAPAPSTSESIPVTVNGAAVQWTDAAPFIDANDRTMVPLRAVADAMDLTVNWDAAAREAAFTGSGKTITFPIDSSTARTSDGGTVPMDTAAVIVNDRTYAPIRYLAEYFGYTVGWDAATRTVTITG